MSGVMNQPSVILPSADTAFARAACGPRGIYTLALLTAIATVNIIDRQVMSLLVQPVKAEMGLSDSQIGVLLGPATGLLYLVLGVPLARLADSHGRKKVIATCLAFFSVASATCGLVTGFGQLLVARIAVAAGEAGTLPASQSIVSVLFPPARRTLALSALTSATCLGTFIAFIGGGFLTSSFGWRATFLILSAPSLLLLLLYVTTTREPAPIDLSGRKRPPLWRSLRILWSNRAYRRVCYAYSSYMTGSLTLVLWMPALLARSYGLNSKAVGLIMGIAVGVIGFAGSYIFGWLAQRAARSDIRWNLWMVGVAATVATPFLWVMLSVHNLRLVLLLGVIPALVCNFHQAPSIAIVQALVPLRMRSEASALILTISSVLAASVGPLLAGVMSDMMAHAAGAESLRVVLLALSCIWPIGAILFWSAARAVTAELPAIAALQAEES